MTRLAALTAVAAEGLAVYVLAELIAAAYVPGSRHAVSAVAFVITAVAAYGHLRLAAWYGFGPAGRLFWLGLVPFIVIYGALRFHFAGDLELWNIGWIGDFTSGERVGEGGGRAVMAAFLLLALWTRSALRAGDEMDLEMIPRTLAVPFAIVTALILLGVPSERSAEVARAGVAFYLVGLLSMCSSQLALSGATIGSLRAGEVTGTLFGAVLLAIAGAVVVLTLAFAVIAPVVGPPIGEALTLLLTVVLYPIAWILEKVIAFLTPSGGPFNDILPQPPTDLTPENLDQSGEDSASLAAFKFIFRAFSLALLLGLAAAAVAFAARFRQRRSELREDVSRTAAGGLAEDAASWLRGLLPRRPARKPRLRRSGILALYDEMLERSARRGRERPGGATPREFAPDMAEVFRTHVTDEITATFEDAYYGSREPHEGKVQDLRDRLDQPAVDD